MTKDFTLKYIKAKTALERTESAIHTKWIGDSDRINQDRAFIKRAKKSDKRRKIEKKSRKRNRK